MKIISRTRSPYLGFIISDNWYFVEPILSWDTLELNYVFDVMNHVKYGKWSY